SPTCTSTVDLENRLVAAPLRERERPHLRPSCPPKSPYGPVVPRSERVVTIALPLLMRNCIVTAQPPRKRPAPPLSGSSSQRSTNSRLTGIPPLCWPVSSFRPPHTGGICSPPPRSSRRASHRSGVPADSASPARCFRMPPRRSRWRRHCPSHRL